MYQITEGKVVRNRYSTIPFTWIRGQSPNKSICIMLPGLGYTTQMPLFYYATNVCMTYNIDVLHVNYQFKENEQFAKLPDAEQEQWIYEDVKATAAEVLKDAEYEQCYLLSKSIGTIPMAMEWAQQTFVHNSVGIWLTPLMKDDKVYQAILETAVPSLCIIGSNDHHFMEERVESFKQNKLVRTVVIPKADHSLEINGDIYASIDALKIVIENSQAFILQNKLD
ncbi:alpha/beta family hydrolase [Neobacillus dielmonensis]|uniref:alpha/beta family hydrolase n=1 Tax=Neobacillus dielmonensis TaxID=1347369 RepID=UPI0005A5FDC9|nr:alpha/beta family hydrolase [Neobacillus dielmonensis]